jgi:hypothetical protein
MTDTPRTTGNEPREGVDPGGTHSTKKHSGKAPAPSHDKDAGTSGGQSVRSGDRNDMPDAKTDG